MRRLSIVTPLLVLAVVLVGASSPASAQSAEADFNSICGACHTIGGGRRVGPDLQGVTERRTREWLVSFITNPSDFASTDADARALMEEFGGTVMPPAPYSRTQIEAIIDFLGGGGGAGGSAPAQPEIPAGDAAQGQDLFQGRTRFDAGGPPCLSCHHVGGDTMFGGGILAKELTDAFTRLGAGGIQGILRAPPFPVMAQAYNGHDLTDGEIGALTGYLQEAASRSGYSLPRENTIKLLVAGLAAFAVLMGLYGVIWRQRKVLPVNHRVFERQIRTE